MKLPALALAAALVAVACDSSTPTLTTADPGTPRTTIPGDTCERLATDTARYLELVVRVLDDTTLEDFRDRDRWPEALHALEQQGQDLDLRVEEMGCDPAVVQQQAFREARLRYDGRLARYLAELLGLE